MSKSILVLAPHPDDEVLGCGGAILLHRKKGHGVAVVFLTSGELGLKEMPAAEARLCREQEAKAAAECLHLSDLTFLRGNDWMLGEEVQKSAALLAPVLARTLPEIIYAPHPADDHPDHRATLPILNSALGLASIQQLPLVRCYEVWTPLHIWSHAEDISPVMEQKLAALRAHKSQVSPTSAAPRKFDYLRAVSGLNQYRGAMVQGSEFAEVFLELSPAEYRDYSCG